MTDGYWHNNWTIRRVNDPFLTGIRRSDNALVLTPPLWILEHMHYSDPYNHTLYQISSHSLFQEELEEEAMCRYCDERISPLEIKKLLLLNRP